MPDGPSCWISRGQDTQRGDQQAGAAGGACYISLQNPIRVEKAGQPVEPVRPQPDRLGACGTGCLLETVEGGGRGSELDDQQGLQRRSLVRGQPRCDPVVHPRMNLGALMVHQPVERAEGRQIGRGFAQRFDRPADQVRRVAHRRGGLEHGSRDQAFPRFGVGHDIEMDAHRGPVAIECLRAGLLGDQRQRIDQPQLHRQLFHGVAMHLDRRRKAAEILAGLQQRGQRQTTGIATGGGTDKDVVGFAQPVTGIQFLTRQSLPQARVSGAVQRGHEVSRKGCAESTAESEGFEGDEA